MHDLKKIVYISNYRLYPTLDYELLSISNYFRCILTIVYKKRDIIV